MTKSPTWYLTMFFAHLFIDKDSLRSQTLKERVGPLPFEYCAMPFSVPQEQRHKLFDSKQQFALSTYVSNKSALHFCSRHPVEMWPCVRLPFLAGCFEKKNAWSSSGMIHLDNLKELAKKFRLHKSIPNFFRDYTTEDSLVAVLKRYVRNNAAFLSLAPSSVARARRSGGAHPHTDPAAGAGGAGGAGGGGGDAPQIIGTLGKTSSVDSVSLLDGGASLGSGGVHGTADDASSVLPTKTTTSGDSENHHPQHRVAGGSFVGVLSSEALHPGGPGGGGMSTGQVSRASGHNTNASAGPHAMGSNRGRRISESSAPRRPLQPKRPTKVGGNSLGAAILWVFFVVCMSGRRNQLHSSPDSAEDQCW